MKQTTKFEKCVSNAVVIFLLSVAVLYGGSKPNMPTETQGGENPLPTCTSFLHLSPPHLLTRWNARGAWNDWARIDFPAGFAFPVGTNLLHGVTLMSQGALRTALTNAVPLVELPAPVAVDPCTSFVSHELTSDGTYRFDWYDVCVDREATNRVDASIELFRSGAIAVTTQSRAPGYQPPVTIYQPPTLPPGFVGDGQDEDWIRANFPADCTNILTMGWSCWLDDEWVGIDEQNGHYRADVTVAELPSDGTPCYLVCGPHKVNVTVPGTYSFPLEVFEHYETRTYPETVPFTIAFDDGYTGEEESYEIISEDETPRLLSLQSMPSETLMFYRFYMKPRVIIAPKIVPLPTANGTRVSFWCKAAAWAQFGFRAAFDDLRLAFFGSEAEIQNARLAQTVEVFLLRDGYRCTGEFVIVEVPDVTPDDSDPCRTDAMLFSGDAYHVSDTDVFLTALTLYGSTNENVVSRSVIVEDGASASIRVYMATTEAGYFSCDDIVSWTVTANDEVVLDGRTSALSHVGVPHGPIYGVASNAVYLAGCTVAAPADGVTIIRLVGRAQNVGDGLRESCVQLVATPSR